jgi:hypothetical protein
MRYFGILVAAVVVVIVVAVETTTELRHQRKYLRHSNNVPHPTTTTATAAAHPVAAIAVSHPTHLYDDIYRFEQWVNLYEIKMSGPEAYLNLLDTWVSNDQYIDMVNSMDLTYRLGHNYFSGMNIVDYANWYIEHVSRDGFIRDRSRANTMDSFVPDREGKSFRNPSNKSAHRYQQHVDSRRCEFGGMGCGVYEFDGVRDGVRDRHHNGVRDRHRGDRPADVALDQRDYQFFDYGSMVGFDKRVFTVGIEEL